jgi:hypothetical protein
MIGNVQIDTSKHWEIAEGLVYALYPESVTVAASV